MFRKNFVNNELSKLAYTIDLQFELATIWNAILEKSEEIDEKKEKIIEKQRKLIIIIKGFSNGKNEHISKELKEKLIETEEKMIELLEEEASLLEEQKLLLMEKEMNVQDTLSEAIK